MYTRYTHRMYVYTCSYYTCCVSAEHSKYLAAPISSFNCRPWECVMNKLSVAVVSISSLRSSFVPTKIISVVGQ